MHHERNVLTDSPNRTCTGTFHKEIVTLIFGVYKCVHCLVFLLFTFSLINIKFLHKADTYTVYSVARR